MDLVYSQGLVFQNKTKSRETRLRIVVLDGSWPRRHTGESRMAGWGQCSNPARPILDPLPFLLAFHFQISCPLD